LYTKKANKKSLPLVIAVILKMNFEQWWTELGPMTKFTLLSSISLTAAVSYGVVPKESLTIDLYATFVQLQVWRLVTRQLFPRDV
jgi:hypothetical protein